MRSDRSLARQRSDPHPDDASGRRWPCPDGGWPCQRLQRPFRLLKRLKLTIEATPQVLTTNRPRSAARRGLTVKKILLLSCRAASSNQGRSSARAANTPCSAPPGCPVTQHGLQPSSVSVSAVRQLKAVVAESSLGLDFSDSNTAMALNSSRTEPSRDSGSKARDLRPSVHLRQDQTACWPTTGSAAIEGELTGLPADHPEVPRMVGEPSCRSRRSDPDRVPGAKVALRRAAELGFIAARLSDSAERRVPFKRPFHCSGRRTAATRG